MMMMEMDFINLFKINVNFESYEVESIFVISTIQILSDLITPQTVELDKVKDSLGVYPL